VIVVPQGDRAVTVIRDTRATNYSCDPQCVAVGGAPERAPAAAGGAAAPAPASPAPAATASR
jgi:hypothetical protein